MTSPTAEANAAADAEWPEGNDVDSGMLTQRSRGTLVRSGRVRALRSFIGWLTANDVAPIAAIPVMAARRPRLPPNSASMAATMNQGFEKSAKFATRRKGGSSFDGGKRATAW